VRIAIWHQFKPPTRLDREIKAEVVVVTGGYLEDGAEACEIKLKDGALDRVYGDGTNAETDGALLYDVA
jgi:hypothetical protein